MAKFTASLLKRSWSATVLNEIIRLLKDKPQYSNFPEDNSKLESDLTTMESWIPAKYASKLKAFLIWMARAAYSNRREFQITADDEDQVKETLLKYSQKFPNGDPLSMTLSQIKDSIAEEPTEKEEDSDMFSPEDWKIIKAGATEIASVGGWSIYKCDKRKSGEKAVAAMGRMCNNKKTGVSWCTGEDRGPVKTYIERGPFYVVMHNEKTMYAFAHETDSSGLDIKNKANVTIWSTGKDGSDEGFDNLKAAAEKKGIQFNFSTISSIPNEIVKVLEEADKKDPYLAERVPAPVPYDAKALKEIVRATPLDGLVEDWNNSATNDPSKVQATMRASIDARQDMKDHYKDFGDDTLPEYITALVAEGYTRLPESLEDFIVEEFH